jgi:hypothetical protein
MKYKGQKQTKNVDDIRKQKPKMVEGWVTNDDVTGLPLPKAYREKRLATVPKKRSEERDISTSDASINMANKIGYNSMDSSIERDGKSRNEGYAKETEEAMKSAGPKTFSMNKPKQLKEIWTPRPLKRK